MSATDLFGLGDRAVARRSDPETSHLAAASVQNITDLQDWILMHFEALGPMIDEQAYDAIGRTNYELITPSGFRSRRSELVAKGLLEWSGEFAETKAGRKARLWRVKR